MSDESPPLEPGVPAPDRGVARESGVVKRVFDEKGFGFITRPDGSDLFFHHRNCECSKLYENEAVNYLLGTDRNGKEEAHRVQRTAGPVAAADVVEWHVDPGTWKSEGFLAPHQGGSRLRFSAQDLARAGGARSTNPRPWHAARYTTIQRADGTQQPVDIQIDWRYPLQRFAFLGDEEAMTRNLKSAVLDEDWDYRTSRSRKPHEILYNYLHFTFARLIDEDRDAAPLDRKIRVRTDLKAHSSLAAFNTGLVDKRYESVFALFEPNDAGRQQPWKLLAFCTPGEDAGKLLSRYFNPLPGPAKYFKEMSELLYDPDAPLHPDYTHILSENRDRLPKSLLGLVTSLDATRAENTLKMHIDRAIDLARKRARWNFKTAIPHYFPTLQRLDFLLPLCLLDDSTVDVALAVQRTETGYIGTTILPLDWAYKSARLVCRPDSDWLTPKGIDAGEEGVLD